jgi:hypothetical protein
MKPHTLFRPRQLFTEGQMEKHGHWSGDRQEPRKQKQYSGWFLEAGNGHQEHAGQTANDT